MKGDNKRILVVVFILILTVNLPVTIKANSTKNHVNYEIKTKRYERHPDKIVRVEFANITGEYSKKSLNNMNYILEKEAFRIATSFVMTDDQLNNTESILHALDKVKLQDIYVWYEVLYNDKDILSIKCSGETTHYTKNNETTLYADDYTYIVFDIKTGKRMDLSDFVTLDRRIVDYKAKNYQKPEYDGVARSIFYSFMDAFRVYENKIDEYHNEINVEEAIKSLKSGSIEWAIDKNKSLFLISYQWDDSCIDIPYSYIKDFAYY